MSRQAAERLGFAPRVDVMFEQPATSRRIWIEFEISRADPVANHAKFGTSRFLEGEHLDGDAFVSMASRHIVPGRLALAAGTAMLMRGFGIAAFQVDLLPGIDAATIQRLNSKPILGKPIDAQSEVDRALKVSDVDVVHEGHRIHRADNPFSVSNNIRQWNAEIKRPDLASLWGRRRLSYFVYDPSSALFAPAKFCAFVPSVRTAEAAQLPQLLKARPAGMTMAIYAMLGEGDPRFDGRIAWQHLNSMLGYNCIEFEHAESRIRAQFDHWREEVHRYVHFRSPIVVLLPPSRGNRGLSTVL